MSWQRSWNNLVRKLEGPILPRPVDYSRDLIKRYHREFGSPADSYPVIHVAGTNGKGSVTYKISKILELSGYRTGFYHSPHLFSWRERVQVDSAPVSKEFCAQFYDRYLQVKGQQGEDLSFFGLMTLLGAEYFREQKVDVAVWEVGMGGRLDATNLLLERSLLSIVTSISLDHTEYLGTTIDQIAGRLMLRRREMRYLQERLSLLDRPECAFPCGQGICGTAPVKQLETTAEGELGLH